MSEQEKTNVSLTNCNVGHEPVWYYDDTNCPVCTAKQLIEDLEGDLQELREQLYDMELDYERAKSRLSELGDE